MKSKNIIKVLKLIADIFKLSIELENKQIEKRLVTPIPDYSKGKKSDGLMIVSQGSEKETIVAPDGKRVEIKPPFNFKETENHLSDSFKYFLDFGGRNSGRTSLYEEWSRKLNKQLKNKGLNNSQPFGFAPIDDKKEYCPKCKSNDISICCERGTFGENIQTYDQCENCKHKFTETKEEFVKQGEFKKYNVLIKPQNINSLKTFLVNGIEKWKFTNDLGELEDALPYVAKQDFQKGMLEADKELQKACKGSKCSHRNTTTSTYYDIPSGKIIFTVKRCNNCNIDLLK